MKKSTLTIGIPAYNEEANIKYLLRDLMNQNLDGLKLDRFVIVSDGSQDNTIKEVESLKNKKTIVIKNQNRTGLANAENQIIANTNSDILVILNADILVKDPNFIRRLVSPIIKGEVNLTSAAMKELPPITFINKVLNVSMDFKTAAFKKYKNGNHIHTCHGTARAFSRELYKKLRFPQSVGEDAYSYLYSVINGLGYKYVTSAFGLYRLPTNFKDHKLQSVRFFQSTEKFVKEFGEEFVKESYRVPKRIMISTFIEYFIKNPFHLSIYLLIYLSLKVNSKFHNKINDKWEVSASSKALRI